MNDNRNNVLLNVVWILIFITLISLPLIGTIFHWDFYSLQDENRPMADFPSFSSLPIKQWPKGIEKYYADHFGFRNTFIRRYNRTMEKIFNKPPERVMVGESGWLFLSEANVMTDFMGYIKLDENVLESLRVSFEGKQRWLENQGIGYLLAVAPNKAVIYPEYLPAEIRNAQGRDGIEQWYSNLAQKKSALNYVDLHKILWKKKNKGMLYLSNDTHWSSLGSYYAYRAVMNGLTKWFPDIQPLPEDSCIFSDMTRNGDLVTFLGDGRKRPIPYKKLRPMSELSDSLTTTPLPETDSEGIVQSFIVNNPRKNGTVVLFFDSFGRCGWSDFFPIHFGQVVFLRAEQPDLKKYKEVVAAYKPDVIIEEQVQRNLFHKEQPVCREWRQALYNNGTAGRIEFQH